MVGVVLGIALKGKTINKGLLEGQIIERIWTVLPAIVLIQLAVPSLLLLYTLDESHETGLTLKTLGHQWYWRYEYSDFWRREEANEFDSYIDPSSTRARLLDTDNRVVLPYGAHVRSIVTRADVLHAWAVPRLGVKVDACPGRMNQTRFMSYRPGLAYGQCSEICGANHRFMPIRLEFVRGPAFIRWLSRQSRDL